MISSRRTPLQVGVPPPLPQKNRMMLRRSDAIGLAGITMLLCGACFIFAIQYPPPRWITWIVGPTLWYVGGATTAIWLLWRLFGERWRNQ